MTIHTDLSKLLRDTLEERCNRNPKYSLRAFARDLAVPAPRLSRWLKGEDGLSQTSAAQLAARLGLSAAETESFIIAMISKYGRAKKMREISKEKLKEISGHYQSLDAEAFKVITDWYNLAALSLVDTIGFDSSPAFVAKRLGISIYEAKGAIARLKSLEMLEENENGKLTATGAFFTNPSEVPSKSVRTFHTQILEKAKTALEMQTVEERDFSTLVLTANDAQIDEAKIFIKKFREEFEKRFCNSNTEKKEVYAFGMQFFRLTEKNQKQSKKTGERK